MDLWASILMRKCPDGNKTAISHVRPLWRSVVGKNLRVICKSNPFGFAGIATIWVTAKGILGISNCSLKRDDHIGLSSIVGISGLVKLRIDVKVWRV